MHFFGLKTVVKQKNVNLGMISARHTTNRQSFKKVTCPFNGNPAPVVRPVFVKVLGIFIHPDSGHAFVVPETRTSVPIIAQNCYANVCVRYIKGIKEVFPF